MTANYTGDDLRAELARLGYEAAAGESKVYAENAPRRWVEGGPRAARP